MAGEARDEAKTIPAAIKRVMYAVFAIYFTLPWVALSALPVRCDADGENCTTLLGVSKADGGYATDPILGIVKNMDLGAIQGAAETYVAVLAVTILVAATNAGVLGVSRLVYSMGIHRQMPDGLRRLHPRFRTPYIGILVFSALACIALLPGQANFLGSIYAFGAMLSFSMAHLAVIRLRVTVPDAPRPYRSPGGVTIRGRELPPFAIAGLAGTVLSFLVISILDLTVAAAGGAWLALGVAIYVVYRRRQGLDLVSTHKVAIPQPVVDHEAEYDSVLVPIVDGTYDDRVMATAMKLAASKRRGVHVLALVTVPNSLPIEAALPDDEAAADSTIEQAKIQGGRRVSGHQEKIRAGQAGRRIIEEAGDMRAAAIVMPLPRRIDGASLFGKTLETVLAERPCRVIIESAPDASRSQRRDAIDRDLLA
jgi:basic amino acid/polyamine antiporter, APA family